ncbi:hypothetical protein T08_9477 [Trichinella sp. T8]|nr:hypothetical protein T08_9477 [Trichinella sp. T8]
MYSQIFFLFVCQSQIAQMRPAPCRYSWLEDVVTESLRRQCLSQLPRSTGQGLRWKCTSIDSCSSLLPPPNP